MDKNEEICRWVAAWIKGELTPEDEAELACWLKHLEFFLFPDRS